MNFRAQLSGREPWCVSGRPSAPVLVSWLTVFGLLGPLLGSAQAQIYSWRNTDGILVLSDRPPADGGPAYLIREHARVGTTGTPPPQESPGLYDDLIDQHAATYGVDADLVRAVIQIESGYDPQATSHKGAMGLMQLMPATAAALGVRNPYDPADNIRGGIAYLRQLLDRYGNREELALAAYNAGPTAVARYGNTVPPYRETRNYVSSVQRQLTASAASSASEPARTEEDAPPARDPKVIYKTTEIVNGRPVPRYSDAKPRAPLYEIIPVEED